MRSDANKKYIGIDIGGTGIKGGLVNLEKGNLIGDRFRIPTPSPATPKAVAKVVNKIIDNFVAPTENNAIIGVTFPAIINNGIAKSAANVDKSWINTNVAKVISAKNNHKIHVVNDADAAGIAEWHFGAGAKKKGLQITLTLGTGIGSALVFNGNLIPNAELGHLELNGFDAEIKASASARERDNLPWEQYSKDRLIPYFEHVQMLFSPDIFIVGGGISRRSDDWLPFLKRKIKTPIFNAGLINNAGIVGAAALAKSYFE